jgi:hypothetical protein
LRSPALGAAVLVVGAGLAAAATAQGTPAGAKTYRIVGVGDIMMGSDYPTPVMDPRLTSTADPASLIGAGLARILKIGDVTFGNMEGTVHTLKGPAKYCKNPRWCYVFRSPPFHARFLRRAGFNMMAQANNHAGDFLDPGRLATYRNLKRAGIVSAGIDKAGMRTGSLTLADGTRVGLIAFGHNPGILWLTDIARAQRLVRALARQVDIVIVSFHGGAEGAQATRVPRRPEIFLGEQRGNVWRFAHAVIDAGADVVLGHGPHVPRAVEVYKRRFIIYSMGNFWTYGRFNLRGLAGLAPVVDLRVTKQGRLVSARIHSAHQVGRGVPQLDPQKRAAAAVANLTRADFPEGGLRFLPDGRIAGPGIGVAAGK